MRKGIVVDDVCSYGRKIIVGENKTYSEYFAIDDKYYAAVTAQLIEEGKVSWKEFYPHETFVDLLKKTTAVLHGKENRSLWVEGAYGTGKSHAALTVKSLLEATDEEVREYFRRYNLKMDLAEEFISAKNNKNQSLIIIHRIGSSSIRSDDDLILSVQESITEALEKHGIENAGEASLRDAALEWLADDVNRDYMGKLISRDDFQWEFSGRSIDDVVQTLKDGDPQAVAATMRSVLQVARKAGIVALRLDAQGMAAWIRSIIKENDLNGILFIWDEFTEYFHNNRNSLTGFQTLAEVSEDTPFYFMIVTHESDALFAGASDAKKIFNRFIEPRIKIELPDNMAFRLMAQAMKKTEDVSLAKEWEGYANELNEERLTKARDIIVADAKKANTGSKMHLKAEDMKGIVPIHPYAALVLKHISVVFSSNQRSMFDFIIDRNMDAKGFKWYINHHGPLDVDNILTVDMLWDFFCVKSQNGLNPEVRSIIDSYNIVQTDKFDEDEKRVFKTILLLQAISQKVGNVTLLRPSEENIDMAFFGTEWAEYKGHSLADQLVKQQILFKRPAGGRMEYIVALNRGDGGAVDKIKEDMRKAKTTKVLVTEAELGSSLNLSKAYQNRFVLHPVTAEDFTRTAQSISQEDWPYQFPVILSFAISEDEAAKIRSLEEQWIRDHKDTGILFVDTTLSPMGRDAYENYIESMAYGKYYQKSDTKQAQGFGQQASQSLQAWKTRVENGSFILYTKDYASGVRCANLEALKEEFRKIDYYFYPYGLEQYNITDEMFAKGPVAQGAGCGISQTLEGRFRNSNKQMSLDNTVFSGVWQVEDYWKDSMKQSLSVVKAKLLLEDMIAKKFKERGRISILEIIESFRQPKFGYMPCNITAVVLGFLLKEYATGEFFWSNGSASTQMTDEKMKTMIANGINEAVTPSKKYKEEFLVAMSAEQSSFLKETIRIFHINPEYCGSIEQARDRVRDAMRKLSFPFWCVKSILPQQEKLVTDPQVIARTIDLYCGLANNGNIGGQNESDIANQIGKLFLENTALGEDVASLAKDELTVEGMRAYVRTYRDGKLLELAQDIGDNGRYIYVIKKKFNAEAANWVWNTQTADEKIDRVIVEYGIVQESNRSLPKCSGFGDCVSEWGKKLSTLKVSYEAVSNMVGDLKDFLEMLYRLKKSAILQDQDKERFYELLKARRTAFDDFCEAQFDYFCKASESLLTELSHEDRQAVFASMVKDHFTRPKTEYFNYVHGKVKDYMENQAKVRLRKLWQEKTGTKDPKDWSQRYRTPILCMFDDDTRLEAKRCFHVIHDANPEGAQVEKAISYLEKADFFDRLADGAERDKCFLQRVVGDNAILMESADDVRDYLEGQVQEKPYWWFDNQTITHAIESKADKEYKLHGCEDALVVIDTMEVQDLKRYLRGLISDNIKVGIQILKNK